jgi:putative FmdB family regulatory protein
MPNYGFTCNGCKKNWDEFLSIKDRDNPTNNICPYCKEQKVVRDWTNTDLSIASDTTLTPNKATGGRWNELMSKMKSGLPSRYSKKLDSSNNMSGRSWKG